MIIKIVDNEHVNKIIDIAVLENYKFKYSLTKEIKDYVSSYDDVRFILLNSQSMHISISTYKDYIADTSSDLFLIYYKLNEMKKDNIF